MAEIVIVGAGFGGLSAAALLAHRGHQITVLEKNNQVGGRASVWKSKGFTFDLGPSWYLMPDVFEDYFAQFGKKPSDYYTLKRLDPSYRLYFSKDEIIDMPAKLEEIIKLFNTLEEDGGKKLQDYLKKTEYFYKTAMGKFVYKDFDSITAFFEPKLATEVKSLSQLLKSFDAFVSQYFTSDKAKKILEYVIVFLGGNPETTPALYSILSYVDMYMGVWYPIGGFGEVPKAFAKLAKENGAKILLEHEVSKIITQDGITTGVRANNNIFKADVVLVNADYHFAETTLLDENHRSYTQKWWDNRTMAPSALLIYLGINKRIKGLRHHTLVLDQDWQAHFKEIFDDPKWPENPSYYVCTPSKTDTTIAPKNTENIFILVPVASGLKDDPKTREAYTNKIITHLEQLVGQNITDHIVTQRIFSHKDFRLNYHAYKGTALGLSHTLGQTAIFRPSIKSKKVKNLYYAGQYTHPGIGTAPSVIAGQIAANMIQKNHG